MTKERLLAVVGLAACLLLLPYLTAGVWSQEDEKKAGATAVPSEKKPKTNKALERTRKQIRMLDAIYKGSIVHVTQQYVDDEDDVPAGTVFKLIFGIAKENGFHEVRLLDASGEAYNDENLPQDDFEKKAIKALKAGKDWHEAIVREDGKRYLRVATPIPVVMDKCIMCHANYKDAKPGAPIGALGYKVPIE